MIMAGLCVATAHAEQSGFFPAWQEGLNCKNSKDWLCLWKSADGHWLNDLRIHWRQQYQVASVDANQGECPGSDGHVEEWRRYRLGAIATMMNKKLKFTNIWDIGGLSTLGSMRNGYWNEGQTGGNLFDLSLCYTGEVLGFKVGKFVPSPTAEYRQSPANMPYVEYAHLVNQLRPQSYGSNWGFEVRNARAEDAFGYAVGVWSTSTSGAYYQRPDWHSTMLTTTLSHAVDGMILKKGRLYLDYVYNFEDMQDLDEVTPASYVGVGAEQLISLNYQGKQDRFELMGDILCGLNPRDLKSEAAGDAVAGVVLTPAYWLNANWQGVFRYQWARGNDAVLLNPRYSRVANCQSGYIDELHTLGFGVNYHVCANNPDMCKLMWEVNYLYSDGGTKAGERQQGFTGWEFMFAVRTSF